jgi:muconolactone D-isomerase
MATWTKSVSYHVGCERITNVRRKTLLYLVDIQVNKPETIAPDQWEALAQAESDYGMEARRNGKQLHIWRKAGAYAAVAVWDVEDNDELHEILSHLPLFPFLEIAVTPLVEHPTSRRWARIQAGEE